MLGKQAGSSSFTRRLSQRLQFHLFSRIWPQQRLQTEFPFELPRGYVDDSGRVHKEGAMRLSTARDELVPLRDLRVQENPAYLSVVLLGRVITRLGDLPAVHDEIGRAHV